VDEITGRKRDRIFSYTPYVGLFRDQPPAADEGEVQETEADLACFLIPLSYGAVGAGPELRSNSIGQQSNAGI
jgi:hypothetical protein